MKCGSPLYRVLALHSTWHFARLERFSLRSRLALRWRTHCQSRPRLAGLAPLMRKASVTNITVSLSLVLVSKALALAHLSVVASLLTILPPPPSPFCPLPPYCPTPLPPGDPLLFPCWHHTAHRRWLASPLPGGSARLPILRDRRRPPPLPPVVVLHCLRGCWQCLHRQIQVRARQLCTVTVSAHKFSGSPLMRNHYPPPSAIVRVLVKLSFLFL